jgi:predicted Fe-S protein YdhL (DUF1289 family)
MANIIEFTVPVRVVSEANLREFWAVRKKRWDAQAVAISLMLPCTTPPLPVVVTMTRIGPRNLDTDNLAGGCKRVRDTIARWLGVDDGPESPVEWRYAQERPAKGAAKYAVRVRIESQVTL